jgi:hypothetical protein
MSAEAAIEALAEWLGELPESRNEVDATDEWSTVLTIDVDRLADLLWSAGYRRGREHS